MLKKFTSSTKAVALALLLVTTFATSMISSTQALAYGKSGSAISTPLRGKVLDHQLYYFLASCAAQVDVDETKDDEVDSWKWFYNGNDRDGQATRGDMYENGNVPCQDGKWIKEAFGRFGFTNARDTICQLGFIYDEKTGGLGKTVNGGNSIAACKSGFGKDGDIQGVGDKAAQSAGIQKLLKTTTKGRLAAAPLAPEAEYVRKYLTLMNGCQINLKEKISKTSTKATNNAQLFKIPVVNKDGTVEWWLGEAPWNDADGRKKELVATTSTSLVGLTKTISCGNLSTDLRGLYEDYAKYVKAHEKDTYDSTLVKDSAEGDGSSDESTCKIDGIGWIICPIFYFMGNLNDTAFEAIDGILTVEPELLTDKTTEDVWKSFRNIANVLFVIAFLVIIYSQMTGFGVSNYGLKRLLPKIIIAAILVNVSFYICQVAVDVSNILGSSLRSLFETIPTDVKSGGSGPTTWDGVMGAVLTVGVGVGLLAVVFLAPSVLLAFGLVLLILVARKALIILLIIVSPLALVAYLLPNTEQWAKKWWKIFSSLLLLFPIIAVVFGASELASNILMGVAQKGGEGGDQQTLLAVVALAVAAVPLFAIPALLKGSLAGAGSIGQKVAGIQDKANKRTSARLGSRRERYGNKLRAGNIKRADDIRGSQKFGSALGDANSRRRRSLAVLGGAGATRAVDNEEKDKYAKISSDAAKRNYVADRAAGDETYAKKLGGGEDLKGLVQSYAVQAQEEEFEKDAKASQVLLRNKAKGMTADGYRSHLESAITSGDLHDRVAAMNEYGSVASDEKVEGLANQMAQLGATSTDSNEKVRMQRAFASSFNDRMPINLGATDKANMQSGNFTADEATRMANTVAGGKVSSGHIGRMKFDEMTAWNKNLTSNNALLESAGSEKVASLIASIESAEKDPRLNVNFGERETTQLAIMKNELQKQFQVAAKHDQDSAASTYGPNI